MRAMIAARTLLGGPAPGPTQVQLRLAEEERSRGVTDVAARGTALAQAEEMLFTRARELAAS
jgi:hypothetical protein